MKILIAIASTHGSTLTIGDVIADQLRAADHDVDTTAIDSELPEVSDFDAVIVGTAIYIGRPLTAGRKLAARLEAEFHPKPVWVFASGLKNNTADPLRPPFTSAATVPYFGSRYPIFGGYVNRESLTVAERSLIGLVGASERDERDFDLIRAWADQVAEELKQYAAAA